MSTVYADTLEPTVPTKDTTLGATGDSITIGANSINTNVIQDSGGNVLFQSDGSGTLSNVNSAFAADLKLWSTQTASGSANLSFTSGIDSTYDVYIFKFVDINPATEYASFTFQASTDGGSSYAVTLTTTAFRALHRESDTEYDFSYQTGMDRAQATTYQPIIDTQDNGAEDCGVGELSLFAPSSTTYVKHWIGIGQGRRSQPATQVSYTAGYFNTTSAINAVDFKMSSGNFDGIIKMYGL